jgi:sugar lactone lactonase YvrE
MRFLLLLAAFVLGSCRSEKDQPQSKLEVASAMHAEPEVTVATTVAFTDGPAQGPDGLIYFTDVTNNRILRFDPRTKKHEVFRADSNRSNGLLFDGEGRLIECNGHSSRVQS